MSGNQTIRDAVIKITLDVDQRGLAAVAQNASGATSTLNMLKAEIQEINQALQAAGQAASQLSGIQINIDEARHGGGRGGGGKGGDHGGAHGNMSNNFLMRGLHHGLVTGSPEAGAHKALQSGIADAANNLHALSGALGVSASSMMLFGGLVAAGAVAMRSFNEWAVEDSKHEREAAAKYGSIISRHVGAAAERHVEGSIRIAEATPDYQAFRQTGIDQRNRSRTEAEIVAKQQASGMDYEHRQQIRERMEHAAELEAKRASASNALNHIGEQQSSLAGASRRHQVDMRNAEQSHQSHMNTLKKKRREKTGVSWAWGMVSGQESDHDAEKFNVQLMAETKEAEIRYQEQLNKGKEAGIKLDQQELQYGQKRVEAASNLLNALRDQASIARSQLEHDKQDVAHAHQTLGAMSVGDQEIVKQIEAKRKKGQKLEPWEKAMVRGLTGTAAAAAAKREDEAAGAALGLEMVPNVQESQTKFDQAQAQLAGKEDELLKLIQMQGQKNEALAAQIAEAIRSSVDMTELVAVMKASYDQLKQWVEEKMREMKRYLK